MSAGIFDLFSIHLFAVAALLLSVMYLSVRFKKLTLAAALAGGVLGAIIYAGAGYTGILLLGAFFIIGSAATSFRRKDKEMYVHEANAENGRNTGQVLANGGVAGLLAALAILDPLHKDIYTMMLAASLAAATADTTSSELGMLYGKNFYNVLTWKKDVKGLDGVISLEGTIAGLAGAGLIAGLYAVREGAGMPVIYIIIAGAAGNMADSYLGATLERRKLVNNDVVNFLNTAAGAVVCLVLFLLFQ